MNSTSLPTVDELMEKAFSPGREPRSAEYKRGVHDMLVRHIEGVRLPIPYDQASAQRDAYYSGWDEGREIWLNLKNTQGMVAAIFRADGDAQEIERRGAIVENDLINIYRRQAGLPPRKVKD